MCIRDSARLQLKGRHRGAGDPADHAGTAAKLKQRGLKRLGSLFQLLVRRRGGRRLRVGMQDFEWRKLKAILFFALVICGAAVRSPIPSRSRSDSTRGRRIGNLGMLQEVGILRCCRDRIHGKRRLGLVNLIGVVFHRKLAGYLFALGMATRQQSCLCGLNRRLVVLVIALSAVSYTHLQQVVNSLAKLGCDVWDKNRALVHVSGHGSQEELKLLMAMAKPTYFMPVHGEAVHLRAHAQLARKMGIKDDHIFILDNGDTLEMRGGIVKRGAPVESGVVYVDGLRIGDTDPVSYTHRFEGPLACVRIGRNVETGEFIVNPTYEERENSDLDLELGGSADFISMRCV